MDLTRYTDTLRDELEAAAAAGGEDARALAERLVAPLESSVRLVVLEALADAADEITRELAPGSVELRLRGREPSFAVTPPPSEDAFDAVNSAEIADAVPEAEDGGTARINLRLPESLKVRVEEAASRERLSVNTWLVRAAEAALTTDAGGPRSAARTRPGGQRYTGWVR